MKRLLLLCFFTVLLSTTSFAETMYVHGIQRITFRTGPGTDHKIIKSLNPGVKLELVEASDVWSKFKIPSGEEGWILNRFTSADVPKELLLKSLEGKYTRLYKRYASLKKNSAKSRDDNQRLSKSFSSSEKEVLQLKTDYENLKKNSSNYIKLENDFKKLSTENKDLKAENEKLGDEVTKKNLIWFSVGAGILLLGMIIGSTSKRKRNSLL